LIELAVAVNGQYFVAERRPGNRLRTDDGGEDDADGSMVVPLGRPVSELARWFPAD